MKIDGAPLLALQGVALCAGVKPLFEGLTMQVRTGEFWCVLGPNGSGKTSLLHAVAGLLAPASGRVELCGRAIDDWPPALAALQRGLLPQALHDAFAARVLDVVLTGRHPHLHGWAWEGEDDVALALDALRSVDLAAFADRDVLTLSGGERARVGIAALLTQDPALMLLDEAIAHLDLKHQLGVLHHLQMLVRQRAKAVMLTTHDLNVAQRFATHVALLGAGTVPLAGPVDTVMTEAALGQAFGHPVLRIRADDVVTFVPR